MNTDNDEGVGLEWALRQLNKKYLSSVQSTGKAQEQPSEETGEMTEDEVQDAIFEGRNTEHPGETETLNRDEKLEQFEQ